jgi:hypothetical protein
MDEHAGRDGLAAGARHGLEVAVVAAGVRASGRDVASLTAGRGQAGG